MTSSQHVQPLTSLCVGLLSLLATCRCQRILEYSLFEELPAHTLVGNVARDARLSTRYNETVLQKLLFTFLTQSSLSTKYLSIDSSNGIITTKTKIDREEICPYLDSCSIDAHVAVQPVEYFQIIKVAFEILDLNDNSPSWSPPKAELRISELSAPGSMFALPHAVDADGGDYSVQSYELQPPSKAFRLREKITPDGSIEPLIVVWRKLDREQRGVYRLTVVAKDGDDPPKSGTLLVDVRIQDANDNDPRFENSTYEVHLKENIAVGTAILKLDARDPDDGRNGRIVYEFASQTVHEYGRLFKLDKRSGEITVTGLVDYEKSAVCLLNVVAHDEGVASLPAHATVIIHVEDENDNAPEITINSLTISGNIEATENSPRGTFVGHVSVFDVDTGRSGKVACNINNNKFKLHKMNPNEFKLVTSRRLDREKNALEAVSLRCRDHGEPARTSSVDLQVVVLDTNDNGPHFSQSLYSAVVQENNAVGASILRVEAVDADTGDNGRVIYSSSQSVAGIVSIDSDTGVISADVVLDYEQVKQVVFEVFARDAATDFMHSSSATVQLIIADGDDGKPEFRHADYLFGIFENEPAGTEVGQVRAVDSDSTPFNQLTYYIQKRDADSELFVVDRSTGAVSTTSVFDREQQSVYYLIVLAVSDNDPTQTSRTSVSVFVADRNDNRPEFVSPVAVNETILISSDLEIGDVAHILSARDRDTNDNAKLRYGIIGGNEANVFAVNADSGQISVNIELKDAAGEQFPLKVRVEDFGNPPLSVESELVFLVREESRLSAWLWMIPTDTLIVILAIVLATLFVAIIFTVMIVVTVRKRKRKCKARDGLLQATHAQTERNETKKRPSDINGTLGKQYGSTIERSTETKPLPALSSWYPPTPTDCEQKPFIGTTARDVSRTCSLDRNGSSHDMMTKSKEKYSSLDTASTSAGGVPSTKSRAQFWKRSLTGSFEACVSGKTSPMAAGDNTERGSLDGGSSDSGHGHSGDDVDSTNVKAPYTYPIQRHTNLHEKGMLDTQGVELRNGDCRKSRDTNSSPKLRSHVHFGQPQSPWESRHDADSVHTSEKPVVSFVRQTSPLAAYTDSGANTQHAVYLC